MTTRKLTSLVRFADLTSMLGHLAVALNQPYGPSITATHRAILQHVAQHLQSYIPGVDPALDAQTTDRLWQAAAAHLRAGDNLLALRQGLSGLAQAPHDPQLWYVVASAYLELKEWKLGLICLEQAVWLHPGFTQARRDKEAVASFLGPDTA